MSAMGFNLHFIFKHTGNVEMPIFVWDMYLESDATSAIIKYYYRSFEFFFILVNTVVMIANQIKITLGLIQRQRSRQYSSKEFTNKLSSRQSQEN